MRLMALAIALIVVGCVPAREARPEGAAPSVQSEPGRTLVAAVRVEPATLATAALRQASVALYLSKRMFNAELALLDERANPRPYLAEALPELGTDSWRVFPDGRMETVYRLKPNLAWHDGAPHTAHDFVFASRVYATPEHGLAGSPPWNAIDEVTALDDRSFLIRWRQPHPDAGVLAARDREFPPLPRHILQISFEQDQPDAFGNHPFWTREYVGLGPYRVDRWEPGAFIEAVAFDRHVLGRPKIERIKMLFISDTNTTLANVLAGEIHLSADSSLRVAQATPLKREWGPEGGAVLFHANQWRAVHFQFRPELATPRALLDPRVRNALAHAVDKPPINDAAYDGNSIVADTMMAPLSETGLAVDRAITKYPYDVRRSEQLMAEAGFRKGTDGVYTSPAHGRFTAEIKTNAATDNEAEMSILASAWRQLGFDVQDRVLSAAQAQDNEVRATFPGMFANNTNVGEPALLNQTTTRIPRPENRWQGGNRGGWSHPEYDRLASAFTTALDPSERTRLIVEMAKIYSEELASISLFFRTIPWAHVAALRGLQVVAPEANMAWNVHEWEFR